MSFRERRTSCRSLLALALLVVAAWSAAGAEDASGEGMEGEIDFLVEAVAGSDCTFIRNGREHEPGDAGKHLEMKRRRGRAHYSSTEEFIDRIASRSSWSGKEYLIRCDGEAARPTGEWLRDRLSAYRQGRTS